MNFYEDLVTIRLRLRLFQTRLGLGERRLRAVVTRLQRRGINLKQHVARFHVRTFNVIFLQQNARDARAYLRRANRINAAGQFRRHRQRFGRDRHHADFRRRRRSGRFFTATGEQHRHNHECRA